MLFKDIFYSNEVQDWLTNTVKDILILSLKDKKIKKLEKELLGMKQELNNFDQEIELLINQQNLKIY